MSTMQQLTGYDSARIIPPTEDNKPKKITRTEDGGMIVEFGNGETGRLDKDDVQIQVFIAWAMITGL